MASNYLNRKDLPRGIRNNNPGNLVQTPINWRGKIPLDKNTDKRFEQFENIAFGIRAMLMDIRNDVRKGKDTLRKLITEYAPPSENDTTAYINSVSKQTGINPDDKINLTGSVLKAIVKAKIAVENGKKAAALVLDSDIDEAIDLIPGKIKNIATGAAIALPFVFLLVFLILKK